MVQTQKDKGVSQGLRSLKLPMAKAATIRAIKYYCIIMRNTNIYKFIQMNKLINEGDKSNSLCRKSQINYIDTSSL